MNEGTPRLKVFLDTACRSVDSSRRRRTCGAKRNKAIGDYADKLAPLDLGGEWGRLPSIDPFAVTCADRVCMAALHQVPCQFHRAVPIKRALPQLSICRSATFGEAENRRSGAIR